jgi:hypothetical protein
MERQHWSRQQHDSDEQAKKEKRHTRLKRSKILLVFPPQAQPSPRVSLSSSLSARQHVTPTNQPSIHPPILRPPPKKKRNDGGVSKRHKKKKKKSNRLCTPLKRGGNRQVDKEEENRSEEKKKKRKSHK